MDPLIYEKEDSFSAPVEDGGEILLTCSNCDKPLVYVTKTDPNGRVEWNLQAECCYCGDCSFIKKISGRFHYRGYDIPHPNKNPEDVVPFVNVTDIEYVMKNGVEIVLFKTIKEKS